MEGALVFGAGGRPKGICKVCCMGRNAPLGGWRIEDGSDVSHRDRGCSWAQRARGRGGPEQEAKVVAEVCPWARRRWGVQEGGCGFLVRGFQPQAAHALQGDRHGGEGAWWQAVPLDPWWELHVPTLHGSGGGEGGGEERLRRVQ
jgi:hypothetical protein